MVEELIVFRYGHRIVRDYRVTSHCSLVSRALGAKKIIVCGARDELMKKSVDDITNRWGGPFEVEFIEDWRKQLNDLKKEGWKLVHLTMYGLPLQKKEKEIINEKKVCIIIGSQKVEKEVYNIVDYNIGVTNQPHSEIAALAITLDRLQEGKELSKKFINKKKEIKPTERDKKVIDLK